MILKWIVYAEFDRIFLIVSNPSKVACRAMGYNCVMDWGLAADWGVGVDEDEANMAIGYWGHNCDGDEPGLQYCCNAPRRWIGDRFRTMSSFSRKRSKSRPRSTTWLDKLFLWALLFRYIGDIKRVFHCLLKGFLRAKKSSKVAGRIFDLTKLQPWPGHRTTLRSNSPRRTPRRSLSSAFWQVSDG